MACEWCEQRPANDSGMCAECIAENARQKAIHFRFSAVTCPITQRVSYKVYTRSCGRNWDYNQEAGNENGRANFAAWANEQGWIAE